MIFQQYFYNVDQHVGTVSSFDLSRSLSLSIKISLAFQSIVFNQTKLSIANEGLCTHACTNICNTLRSQVNETTARTGKYIKNDIFIEFLARNQHLLKPSIIDYCCCCVVDDDDDEIKLLSIQKYRLIKRVQSL